MTIRDLKDAFIKDPTVIFNVSTKIRKDILLSNDTNIIHHGSLYDIKFKNCGGGVYEVRCEKRNYLK